MLYKPLRPQEHYFNDTVLALNKNVRIFYKLTPHGEKPVRQSAHAPSPRPPRQSLYSTYLPVLVTIISLVNSLNLFHNSASSNVSLISLSDASPFSLPFWNSLSTALRRCSRRWSGLEEVIFPSRVARPKSKTGLTDSDTAADERGQALVMQVSQRRGLII